MKVHHKFFQEVGLKERKIVKAIILNLKGKISNNSLALRWPQKITTVLISEKIASLDRFLISPKSGK